MKLRKDIINSNRSAVIWIISPIDKNRRWKIWRQFDSPFCNHPFWVTLQKRGFFIAWKDVSSVNEPFYFKYGDTCESFTKQVLAEIEGLI